MKDLHIDSEFVSHIAWLARLSLSEEQLSSFPEQFREILEFVSKVESLPEDTETVFYLGENSVPEAREDSITESKEEIRSLIKEQFLQKTKEGYLLIKRIFDR